MDKECSKEHLLDIALWDFDWEPVGRRLLSSEQNVTDIDTDKSAEQNKRDKMLITWQSQEGPKATYKVLMETFQDLGYGHLAEKLMHLAGEGNNEEIAQSRVIQAGTKQPGQSCLAHHCGCNQNPCDLEKLIQQGCPNYCNTDLFPFLNTEALTEGEIKSLQSMLDKQGKSMSREFDKIKKKFKLMMKKMDLSLFKAALLSISGFDSFKRNIRALQDRKKDIKSAKEHDELVDIIEDYITWFNCTLLKEIVKECVEMGEVLTDHDSFCECFETYEKARILYCRRGIFECPSDLFSKNRQLESCTKLFCLLVNDDKIRNIENLDLFEGELCIIFGMKRNNIILCSIGKGCIELVYLLPSCVHEVLFPLNKKQLQGLAMIGVTAICIGTSYESINTLLENENSTLYLIASNNNRGHHDFKEKFAACRKYFEILKIHCCSALRSASVEELTRCVADVPQKPHYQQYILKCSGNLRQCSSVNEFFATLGSSYSNYLFYQLFEKVAVTYGNEMLVREMEEYKDKITSITTKAKVEELNDTRSCIINTTADCEVEVVLQIPFSYCTISDIEDVRDEIRRISYMFEFCHTLCGISGDSDTTTTKWVIPNVYSRHLQVDLLLSTIPLGKHFGTKQDAPRQLLTAYGVLKICIDGLCVFEYDPNCKEIKQLRSILKHCIMTNIESQLDHLTRPDDLSFRKSNITRVLQFSIDQWLEFALRLGLFPQDIADCWSAQTRDCNFPSILLKKWLSTDDSASWYTLMTIVKPMLPPACDYANTIVQQYPQITEVNEKELQDLEETIPFIVRLPANVVEDLNEMEHMDVERAVKNVENAVEERFKAIEEVLQADHEDLKQKSKSEEYWKRQEQLDKDLMNALSRQDAEIESLLERTERLCSDLCEQNNELQQSINKVTEVSQTINKLKNNVQSKKIIFEELNEQLIRLRRLKSRNAERLAALTSIPSKVYQLEQDAKKNRELCNDAKTKRYSLLQKQVELLSNIIKLLGDNEHRLDDVTKDMIKMLDVWADFYAKASRAAKVAAVAGLGAAAATTVLTFLTFGTTAPLAAVAVASAAVGTGAAVAGGIYGWNSYEQTGRKNVNIFSEHVKSTQAKRQRLINQSDEIRRKILAI